MLKLGHPLGRERKRPRFRPGPLALLILLGALIAAIVFAADTYRHRFVRSDAQMFEYLPQAGAAVFYANAAALRSSGLFKLLSGSQAEEADYRDFVRKTQFDYSRDIDTVAGALDGKQTFVIARGRFDWGKLRRYAATDGGSCEGSICSLPASKSGRWISFLPVQADVIGLAISNDHWAARILQPPKHGKPQDVSRSPVWGRPVWIKVSPSLLRNPVSLPLGVRIFAVSLQPADPVFLSVKPATSENRQVMFDLQLDAICPSEPTADTVRNQLEIQTKMFKLELAREHEQPNPSDFSGLLTAGTFQLVGNQVIGIWPVRRELVNSLR
jgi:hypothetical protein